MFSPYYSSKQSLSQTDLHNSFRYALYFLLLILGVHSFSPQEYFLLPGSILAYKNSTNPLRTGLRATIRRKIAQILTLGTPAFELQFQPLPGKPTLGTFLNSFLPQFLHLKYGDRSNFPYAYCEE